MNVIVTGATKGIGKAIVLAFAAEGANVAFCARNQGDIDVFLAELIENYPNQKFIAKATDVSKKEDRNAFFSFVDDNFETIDVLVNNAGFFIPGKIHQEVEGILESMIETNLYSAYYASKHFAQKMIQQKAGHIFNICSIASIIAYANGGSYSISKFAMLGMNKVLRQELMEYNIRVTAILPGAVLTNAWDGANIPENRFIPAEDIANAVLGTYKMSEFTNVEELLIRPQKGDI